MVSCEYCFSAELAFALIFGGAGTYCLSKIICFMSKICSKFIHRPKCNCNKCEK